MKKLLLSAFVAFAMLASTKALAQQGFGTNTPNKSAAVDIVSSQRGLLVPRLDLSSIVVAAPVDAPAHGLLVYNKVTSTLTGTEVANNVTPGFYYWERNNTTDETAWQGKWVRIVSSNTEKKVIVEEGNNVKVVADDAGLTTIYTVSVTGGNGNGQVLVSVPNTDPATSADEPFVSEWVDPDDFIKGVNGINVTTDALGNTNVSIGGALTKPGTTEITTNSATNSLAITGLDILDNAAFDPATQNIVVMGSDGILKEVSPKTLIEDTIDAGTLAAKKISSTGGIITINNTTELTNSVLKDIELGIADKSIGVEKLNPGTAAPGQIATVVEITPGTNEIKYVDPSTAIGKDLTTDNIIGVGADNNAASATTANLLEGSVLTPTYLKIKDNSITALQIGTGAVGANELATGAVTADKLSTKDSENGTAAPANTVPVANSNGTVTYKTVAEVAGEDLTTDGKIVIGATGNSQSLTDAVLVATHLRIAPESITSADILNGTIESADIKDGTITTTDIKAPNSSTDNNLDGDENMVMVTDTNGDVKWIAQSALANKDNYTFTAPLSKDAGTLNTTTGGTDYNVTIATASATTLGVVKQADTNPEIAIDADGSLSVNEANVNLSGDVTGSLNATKVGAIQGTAVSATPPTSTNNVLKYVDGTGGAAGQWVPSQLQGTDINGAALSSSSITVTPASGTTNVALLEALTIDITPGTAGQILTTIGALGSETTTWSSPNSLVSVANGLNKDNTDIELGGKLKRATVIETGLNSVDQLPANTLAINGLINVAPTVATKNKIIVAETTGGILRTVDKVIYGTDANVAANAGYSFHTPEVTISVTLGSNDQTIVFPSAASAEGQVINIKIANTTEAHSGYLNILDTYGSMPYQAWIVKSNGTAWQIVGRN